MCLNPPVRFSVIATQDSKWIVTKLIDKHKVWLSTVQSEATSGKSRGQLVLVQTVARMNVWKEYVSLPNGILN